MEGEVVEKRKVEETNNEGEKQKRGTQRGCSLVLAPLQISSHCGSPVAVDGGLMAAGRGGGGKVRPFQVSRKQARFQYQSTGERIAYSVGTNFTPHIINVNIGEDVTMRILSFSQQGMCAICILSTTGSISNVTLRQLNSSGGTITYEGCFELLSLTGSFIPTDKHGAKSRSGGMSVSLAGPDGRVIGGGLAGMLIAATPVQVVVGSFLPGHQQEQQKQEAAATTEHSVECISTECNRYRNGGGSGCVARGFMEPWET